MKLITETHAEHIRGTLSCYDRIIIQGTLPSFCYAKGMTSFLHEKKIRIFDYPQFAQGLRNELIAHAQKIASENNLKIEYIPKKNFRQEKRIAEILKKRGDHPGLVHIFSVQESCTSYKPWHDKNTHKTFLKYDPSGKCLHYYFYFIHKILGLCYVRVPTWIPFRLQIYCNGHTWLASQLQKQKIPYTLCDNAFLDIGDFQKAQEIANGFSPEHLHTILDEFSRKYCPFLKEFHLSYHWSVMQIEYATDIVFRQQSYLQTMYDTLARTAIHTVKPENIATFLGKKLHGNYQDDMGNRFNTRIEGTRIKHVMGPASVKLYDKFGIMLRIETTTYDVSFFEHYRKVEHRDGTSETKVAHVKKGIYSLVSLQNIFLRANHRYLEFISTFDDNRVGSVNLNKISKNVTEKNHTYKGFNFFHDHDQQIFLSIARGEFNIRGFQNKNLRIKLKEKTTSQICRIIKRLRVHGLIRKITHSYKYHLTTFGRKVIALGLKLKELVIIPQLAVQN
ncbi:conserved hypothetical protein [Candidatus Brocadia pituitae]|nr:conserved hypothetical protein [Candidatus Brocadia pituitae]